MRTKTSVVILTFAGLFLAAGAALLVALPAGQKTAGLVKMPELGAKLDPALHDYIKEIVVVGQGFVAADPAATRQKLFDMKVPAVMRQRHLQIVLALDRLADAQKNSQKTAAALAEKDVRAAFNDFVLLVIE